ncbi:putative transferase CAF17, mitochondrial [Nymphon striatum]|nr:putative transferase CAF17, mitochondrial [Nymphon striatum]
MAINSYSLFLMFMRLHTYNVNLSPFALNALQVQRGELKKSRIQVMLNQVDFTSVLQGGLRTLFEKGCSNYYTNKTMLLTFMNQSVFNFRQNFKMLHFFSRYALKTSRNCHFRQSKRCISSDGITFSLEQLKNRKLLIVKGPDSIALLQGLVTNDMRLLEDKTCKIMYSFMLTPDGRVLYDLMISSRNTESGPEYLTECDYRVADELVKLLKMYKLRRKVSIEVADDMCVWCVIPKTSADTGSNFHANMAFYTNHVSCSPFLSLQNKTFDNVNKINDNPAELLNDPRIVDLGARLYVEKGTIPNDIYDFNQTVADNVNSPYTHLRYQLGIAEGVAELPPGKALPLESNVDFLHGISFDKGCYVGQELTARTYHTGEIRKRIVPFCVDKQLDISPQVDSAIENESGKSVGKFRNIDSLNGLALVRLQKASKAKVLKIAGSANITIKMPHWWPFIAMFYFKCFLLKSAPEKKFQSLQGSYKVLNLEIHFQGLKKS